MGQTFRGMMWLLGLVIAVPAVISLIQHVLQVGLAPHLSDIVTFYRGVADPVFDVLYWPLGPILRSVDWAIPIWLRDVHALSFVGAGIGARGLALYQQEHEGMRSITAAFAVPLLTFLGGVTFYGLIFIAVMPFAVGALFENSRDSVVLQARSIALTFIAILGAVVAFYAVNYVEMN